MYITNDPVKNKINSQRELNHETQLRFCQRHTRLSSGFHRKTRITIFLDDDILTAFREQAAQSGKGYQALINEALRNSLSPESAPLTVETLRKILHEELHVA